MPAQPAQPTTKTETAEVDPRIALAQQQEQYEADMAQLAHLQARVPLLRAQLNEALARVAQLEKTRQPTDRRRATTKRTTTKAAATTKGK
ncbi:hypothetical protein GCM10023340_08590 [Nocardioides marinquilinus]|uniref:Uncharacterized protein n=1 Tax=Nocardioides marinquilinus TaxID=1210400 RepID=A0ABP9PAA0_9ACTN